MFSSRLFLFVLVTISIAAVGQAAAANDGGAPNCFDTEVVAKIIAQVPMPMPMPETDDGSIVMRWPWFVDLDVRKSLEGSPANGKITTQALMHTYWRSNLGYRRWLLRRNELGSFNLIGLAPDSAIRRCEQNAPSARPYLTPAEGSSLDELRRQGEAQYGRHAQ